MHININIAVPQIGDYDLPLFIADEIKKNGLNGSDITFEITETYQIKDIKSITKLCTCYPPFGRRNCSG